MDYETNPQDAQRGSAVKCFSAQADFAHAKSSEACRSQKIIDRV
jgi:hypothetical protein